MKNFSTAWLTTNRNCNNNCSWCYARNTLHNKGIMSLDDAKLAVDELARRGVKSIVLIGGEPTIYPYFFELSRYIKSKGIKVRVPSNGRKFKELEFAQETKDAGIDSIDISIKALTEEDYHRNTNSYGLHDMLEGYHNLKKVGIHVSTSFVIVNDSRKDFDELVRFLKENDITSINLQFVKPTLSLGQEDEIMKISEMGRFVEYIYEKMSQTGIQYGIEISFPICLIKRDVFDALVKENRVVNCCHVPKGTGINFDESFKVIPCNHFAEFPFSDTPVDFSNPDDIDQLMESEVVKEFRYKARCYPTVKCQTCADWEICGGGCFTRWLSVNPNDYIK